MKKSLVHLFMICLITGFAWSQDTRPTVAILDFEGQGISVQEVQTPVSYTHLTLPTILLV